MKKIKVIYAEDNALFRQTVSAALAEYKIEVIAQACNGRELIRHMHKHPDLVLLDLEMPVMDGNDAFEQIMHDFPDTKIIIVSMHYEQLLVDNYMERGAMGYISKDLFSGDMGLLAESIHNAAAGKTCINYSTVYVTKFSSRQKELIPMMVNGYTNREIADQTGIQERAVEKQRQKIYYKLGGQKAIDFYRYAFSKGLQFLRIKNKPLSH